MLILAGAAAEAAAVGIVFCGAFPRGTRGADAAEGATERPLFSMKGGVALVVSRQAP